MANRPAPGYPRVVAGCDFRSRRALAVIIGRRFGRSAHAVCEMLRRYDDDGEAVVRAYLGKEVRYDGERWRNRWQFQLTIAARYGIPAHRVAWWWHRQPSPAAVIERAAEHAAGPRLPGV